MVAKHCLIASVSALDIAIDNVWVVSLMPHALELASSRVSPAVPSTGGCHGVMFAFHSAPSLACILDAESD